jgi:hypothetical protein
MLLFLTSTAFQILQLFHITVFHLIYVLGPIELFFQIYTFHSTYVPDFKIAHFSSTMFHLIVTQSSISHFISDFVNLFKKCALDVNISQGYHTSINSFFIVIALRGCSFTNSLIASVISYSHLLDCGILFAKSIILELNL